MPDIFSPLTDMCQNQLETSRRIADAFFIGTGKLENVALDTAHRATDEQFHFAQAVGKARDMQAFSNLQSTYWAGKPIQFQKFQQEWIRILAEIQNEVGRATQAYAEHFSSGAMRSMPYRTSGARSNEGIQTPNPFGGMVSAWENAMQGASRFSEQAMESVRNVTRGFQSAAGQASRHDTKRDTHSAARRGSDYASAFVAEPEPADICEDETIVDADTTQQQARHESAGGEPETGLQGEGEGSSPTDMSPESTQESRKSSAGRRKQK
jgi:hypothetical protein